MGAAVGWGALAASSLIIGAVVGLARPWPDQLVGLVLSFGPGALISAVSFDLAEEGARLGRPGTLAIGLAAGALTYFFADRMVDRLSGGAGPSLALGAFLDGIPEQLVLGLGIALGDGVSVGLLAAIFVSNLPEAIGSASDMLAARRPRGQILGLWAGVAVVCTLATVAGYAMAEAASDELKGAIDGFAAGALLVMLTDSMIPEARKKAGLAGGLVVVLGFAVAAGLSGLSG